MWAQWLHHRCRPEIPNAQAGKKSSSGDFTHAISGPTCGQSGYITPAIAGSPTLAAGQNEKWLLHPCHLREPHVGKVAT